MPELRKDPITQEWVIIAVERGKRPSDFVFLENTSPDGRPEWSEDCPFCPGNEGKTPAEVLAYRKDGAPNGPGWWVRVVPNRYPALAIEGGLRKAGRGLYDTMNGVGAHEVIIESSLHNTTLARLGEAAIADVIWTWRDRYLDLRKDRRLQYILIFRNQGKLAGASLVHPHSQLVATSIVPLDIMQEIEGFKRYQEFHDRCVMCDILVQELDEGERVVLENDHFVAIEPFVSKFPFQTMIMPKVHRGAFVDMSREEVEQFASILKGALLKLEVCLRNPPYNFNLHTAPCGQEHTDGFHWHLDIAPKLTTPAGFEMGTGIYINVTRPEDAAAFLREADAAVRGTPILELAAP